MTQKRMGPAPDQQAGEKLFKALRELEVQFLNGGHSVQTSIQKLLKDHKFSPVNEMGKYLVAQSILKRDPDNGSHKKPFYFYNGPRLSVQYCNELILQMKIERAADEKLKDPPLRDTTSYMKDGRIIKGTPFDENLYDGNKPRPKMKKSDSLPPPSPKKIELSINGIEEAYKARMLEDAIEIRDGARRDINLYSQKLEEAQIIADEYSIVIKYLLPKKPF